MFPLPSLLQEIKREREKTVSRIQDFLSLFSTDKRQTRGKINWRKGLTCSACHLYFASSIDITCGNKTRNTLVYDLFLLPLRQFLIRPFCLTLSSYVSRKKVQRKRLLTVQITNRTERERWFVPDDKTRRVKDLAIQLKKGKCSEKREKLSS